MSNTEPVVPDTESCARMLLETIPPLMRMLHGAMRKSHGEAHTFGQMRMLAMLRERPCMLTDLATRHHVAPSTMSRTVDALVERGWVARTGAPDDRRKVLLTLTEQGAKSLDMLFDESCGIVAELMVPLAEQERGELVRGLAVLRHLANHSSSLSEKGTD